MTGRRGWCPTVFEPMATGDGLLARVKPRFGVLASGAARALATAARRHGNGVVGLTSRANVQVRGLRANSVAAFAEEMVAAGLADWDAGVERRRNVVVSPLAGSDPDVAAETLEVARAVSAVLAEARYAALDGKFGVVVDGGGVVPLGDVAGDVVLRSGSWGSAAAVVRAAIEKGLVGPLPRTPPARGGEKKGSSSPLPLREGSGGGETRAASGGGEKRVGFVRYRASDVGAFGFAPAFGLMRGEALDALAGAAERFGDGMLRVTPWRTILIAGVAAAGVAELERLGEAAGLIVRAGDRRLLIVACAGKPACAQATVDTQADAAWLAESDVALGGVVHVSGCAKGRARPRDAWATLVGREGRYDAVVEGFGL